MKQILFLLIFFLFLPPARADYLVVSRSATIREHSSADSRIVGKVQAGDTLMLLSLNQENGYFHVRIPSQPIEGWIYRTLVRRYEGELPVSPVSNGNDLVIRVLDVGAGLCVLITLPDNRYIIYDAGHYRGNGKTTLSQVEEVIPAGSTIEQMILSHNDGDHIGAAANIIQAYQVRKVVYTGYERSMISGESQSASYRNMISAMNDASYPLKQVNLNRCDSTIKPGLTETYGDVKLTFLCGFGSPPQEWGLKDKAEKLNSVSIVVKLEYHGVSILLSGDIVGRHREDENPDALIATEKYLVEKASGLLNSDILIAPHHGGNNASSTSFIEKVSPEAVIFSAGHEYFHPTRAAAARYLKTVDINRMFRTDRGDDECGNTGECLEWDYEKIPECIDSFRDDDVEIRISANGKYKIAYLFGNGVCGD